MISDNEHQWLNLQITPDANTCEGTIYYVIQCSYSITRISLCQLLTADPYSTPIKETNGGCFQSSKYGLSYTSAIASLHAILYCKWLACCNWKHCYWPALRAGLLCCNFFGQPGSVSKFPPFVWIKLWVGWVGRGYTEISRYFPASWINWVTLVTKIKLLYSLRF